MFREFVRAANGELNKFVRDFIRMDIELVEGALAVAARGDEFAVREQTKMRGDARLAEARDFLQLVDGKFIAFQQRDDAEARRVGQRAERFQGGGHKFFCIAK